MLLPALACVLIGVARAATVSSIAILPLDHHLCARLAGALDTAQLIRGRLHFSAGEVASVDWSPVKLKGDGPKETVCSTFEQARVDLRRNGTTDLVIRSSFCMKRRPSDSLYVFPAESDVLARATWQELGPLHETQIKVEHTGGSYSLNQLQDSEQTVELREVFSLNVVQVEEQALIALTAPPFEWIVVARLRGAGPLEDVCYLRRDK
ncbi:hypothetical protein YTPLAS18_13940 [Nitrospira sp.]|nr:hypothetical protein YTPLAS18_13940 [Nitrospira sp.]